MYSLSPYIIASRQSLTLAIFYFSWHTKPVHVISQTYGLAHKHPFTCVLEFLPFKNGPENLIRRTAKVFMLMMRYLWWDFALEIFLVLWSYAFVTFSLICLMESVSNISKFLEFFFYPCVLSFVVLFIFCFSFTFFRISLAHYFIPNYIHISWLYVIIVCIKGFSAFSVCQISLYRPYT